MEYNLLLSFSVLVYSALNYSAKLVAWSKLFRRKPVISTVAIALVFISSLSVRLLTWQAFAGSIDLELETNAAVCKSFRYANLLRRHHLGPWTLLKIFTAFYESRRHEISALQT